MSKDVVIVDLFWRISVFGSFAIACRTENLSYGVCALIVMALMDITIAEYLHPRRRGASHKPK